MTGGSQQLRIWRRARRDGDTLMTACVKSGIPLAEARLWDAEDRENPPPPEAFELLNTPPSGPPMEKEEDMARPRKAPRVEEVRAPDYALAVRFYREDIKPAQSKVGEYAQEQSTAFKAIKKQAGIQPQAAKAAFRLDTMESAKRDDWLRSFNGLLKELGIFMPRDMVDQAEGKGAVGEEVVPAGERPRPKLVTIPTGPADDSDLNPEDPPAESETGTVTISDSANLGPNGEDEVPISELPPEQQAAE